MVIKRIKMIESFIIRKSAHSILQLQLFTLNFVLQCNSTKLEDCSAVLTNWISNRNICQHCIYKSNNFTVISRKEYRIYTVRKMSI